MPLPKLVGTAVVLFLSAAPGYAEPPGASAPGGGADPPASRTYFQAAIFTPVQIYSESTDVRGFRINLPYGKNANVYGLDVGVVNRAQDRAGGLQVAGLANDTRELDGVQLGLGFNDAWSRARGFQGAGFVNLAGELDGAQTGFMYNEVDGRVRGFQATGIVNIAAGVKGVQISGIHNKCESVVGAQISGLVNQTEELVGVQIGLLNFNAGGPLPFFPFVNIGFRR